MTDKDLVPYEPSASVISAQGKVESPSKYWQVTKVEPVHMTGRWSLQQYKLLLVEFTHALPNGDRLVVEAYVDQSWKMERLRAFLDAARELPAGIRLRIHTIEKVPWDRARGR